MRVWTKVALRNESLEHSDRRAPETVCDKVEGMLDRPGGIRPCFEVTTVTCLIRLEVNLQKLPWTEQ